MRYYLIYKTDKKTKSEEAIVLWGGYNFVKKLSITLYDREMIRYILLKKLNSSLKSLINLYLLAEESDDTDADANRDLMIPKIENMRRILLEKYSFFLEASEVENYLTKLEKMENKISRHHSKKSRRL